MPWSSMCRNWALQRLRGVSCRGWPVALQRWANFKWLDSQIASTEHRFTSKFACVQMRFLLQNFDSFLIPKCRGYNPLTCLKYLEIVTLLRQVAILESHRDPPDSSSQGYDECIWCTQGSPQSWVGTSGLHTDSDGFLLVDQHMRVLVTKNAWKFRSGVLVFLQKSACIATGAKLVSLQQGKTKCFWNAIFPVWLPWWWEDVYP